MQCAYFRHFWDNFMLLQYFKRLLQSSVFGIVTFQTVVANLSNPGILIFLDYVQHNFSWLSEKCNCLEELLSRNQYNETMYRKACVMLDLRSWTFFEFRLPAHAALVTLTKSPPRSIHPSLLVDRRKVFKSSVSISRPVTMTMALAWKTNERPGAPVLTAKMSFSPIASPTWTSTTSLPAPRSEVGGGYLLSNG